MLRSVSDFRGSDSMMMTVGLGARETAHFHFVLNSGPDYRYPRWHRDELEVVNVTAELNPTGPATPLKYVQLIEYPNEPNPPLFHVHGPQSPLSSLARTLAHFLVFSSNGQGGTVRRMTMILWIYR
jgi:hypothetical protein